MREKIKSTHLLGLWNKISENMKKVSLAPRTISTYQRVVVELDDFMYNNNFVEYSPSVGENFLVNLFSGGILSVNKRVFCKALVDRLDACFSDDFWGEKYSPRRYSIKNHNLLRLLEKMKASFNSLGRKKQTCENTFLCLRRLDIYMSENNETTYTPEIGERFLECMKLVSNLSLRHFHTVYSANIERLNAYYVEEIPFERFSREYKIHNTRIQETLDRLLDIVIKRRYVNLFNITSMITKLDFYMSCKGIDQYTTKVGEAFVEYYNKFHPKICKDNDSITIIAHFNDVFTGKTIRKHLSKPKPDVPEEFKEVFGAYERECMERGNSLRTIDTKTSICTRFFIELKQLDISSINEITPDLVVEITAKLPSSYWQNIRAYLHYCALQNLTPRDYSYFVPTRRTKVLIPEYYTKEERQRLEKAPDRTTPIGKRDYAIILLANRLAIRGCDIANFSFSEFEKGKKTIDFTQLKTGYSHSLPLLEEIRMAVEDYVNYGRPESDSDKIFLTSISPFIPIKSSSFHTIITKNFLRANVNIFSKRHGITSLRSSLGTDLVNNGFSYNETSKIFGHHDRETITYYATIDIKLLQNCALNAYAPSGSFATALGMTSNIEVLP